MDETGYMATTPYTVSELCGPEQPQTKRKGSIMYTLMNRYGLFGKEIFQTIQEAKAAQAEKDKDEKWVVVEATALTPMRILADKRKRPLQKKVCLRLAEMGGYAKDMRDVYQGNEALYQALMRALDNSFVSFDNTTNGEHSGIILTKCGMKIALS